MVRFSLFFTLALFTNFSFFHFKCKVIIVCYAARVNMRMHNFQAENVERIES